MMTREKKKKKLPAGKVLLFLKGQKKRGNQCILVISDILISLGFC